MMGAAMVGRPRRDLGFVALVLVVAAGCEKPPVSPDLGAVNLRAQPSFALLECPNHAEKTASRVVGPRGGMLATEHSVVFFPPLAVGTPTSFTLRNPASQYLEVAIEAAGQHSFTFARPVAVMIGYQHCARQNHPTPQLSVWELDPETNQPVAPMRTFSDPRRQIIGFLTDHLSVFAVAH